MVKITPDIPLVSASRDPGVAIDIQGAGALGRGIKALGDFGLRKTAELKAEREALNDAAYETYATTTAQQEIQKAVVEEQTKGGQDYTKRITDRVKDIVDNIPETYTGEKPSKIGMARVGNRLVTQASGAITSGVVFEHNATVQQTLQGQQQAVQTAGIDTFDNPGNYKQNLSTQMANIQAFTGILSPDQIKDAEKNIGAQLTDAAIRGELEQDPAQALQLLKAGEFDAHLTPKLKASYIDAAQADVKAQGSKERRKLNGLLADNYASIANTGQPVPGVAALAKNTLDPTEYAAYQREETNAKIIHTTTQALKTAGPGAAQDLIDKNMPVPGTIGFADRQKTISALQRATTAEAKEDINKLAKDNLARILVTGKDDATVDDLATRFLDPDDLSDYQDKKAGAKKTYKTMQELKFSDPQEADRILKEVAPTADAEDFYDKQAIYNETQKTWVSIQKARAADPAGYAMLDKDTREEFKIVQDQYIAATDVDTKGAAAKSFQKFMKERRQAQMDMGVREPKLLSAQERDTFVSDIQQREDGQAKADYIGEQANRFGPLWPQALKEMSDLPPGIAVASTLVRPGQHAARVRFMDAVTVGSKTLRGQLSPQQLNDVREDVDEKAIPFLNTMAKTPGGAAISAKYRSAVQLLTYQYVAEGAASEDAAQKAYDDIIGKYYSFVDTYRIPKGAGESDDRSDNIENTLEIIMDDIPATFDIAAPPSLVLSSEEAVEEYTDAIETNGYWVTAGDDSGVYLYDEFGRTVLQKDGTPAFISFIDAEQQNINRVNEIGRTAVPGVPFPRAQ